METGADGIVILYVANRGEIARRVLRTAKRMKFKTAVGYADQDKDLPFVREADVGVPLQGEEALETYLNIPKVIEAAKKAQATHLHPGYGFLSENPNFVDAVTKAGIKFVGPPAQAMRLLGDKIGSRNFLKSHDVPLLPSYEGDDQSEARLRAEALKLGYPVLIKPSAGGGGKGMMKVYKDEEFAEALASAKRVAEKSFADDRVFLERLIEPARHIEVQIMADQKGHVLAFGERECSLQRRHQKVFEETPCLYLSKNLRQRILEASVTIAKAARYESAGTVEWIWDGKDGIYFLEVNARLQVEHPVTELVYRVDLVEQQLRVALGESIASLKVEPEGHAIEARVCAEDPSQEFLPSAGKIHRLHLPSLIRVDCGYAEKNTVPSQFDSLIGKWIAFGANRKEAIQKLKSALEETIISGPKTNRGFLIRVLQDARVQNGDLSTQMLADISPGVSVAETLELLKQVQTSGVSSDAVVSPASTSSEIEDEDLDFYSPWGAIARSSAGGSSTSSVVFEDFGDLRYFHTPMLDWSEPSPRKRAKAQGTEADHRQSETHVSSPMPAKVVKILVSVGQQIAKGQSLMVLEAMKMEHQLKSGSDGKVTKISASEGDRVGQDQVLIEWEKS